MKWIKANPLLFSLILLVVILLVVYLVKHGKKIPVASLFPLHYGSTGAEVLSVQKYLNTNNNCGLVPDGIFGKDMEKCVQDIYGTTFIDQVTYNKIITDTSLGQLQVLINDTVGNISGWFGRSTA